MSEIITSTEQEILIAHMVDRLPALRKKYGIKLKDTSFVEWMLDSGYRELLLEYPVLLDQISNILVEFIDLIEECVQKLELHKEDIYRKFIESITIYK